MSFRAPDVCTLVWPILPQSKADPTSSPPYRWLVGWNPRALVVVAAFVIDAPSFEKANELVALAQKKLADITPVAVSRDAWSLAISTLRLIGRLRSAKKADRLTHEHESRFTTMSCNDTLAQQELSRGDGELYSSRKPRLHADIWLEIQPDKPSIEQLFCCGFRVPEFNVSVVHCNPSQLFLQSTPTVLTPLSLYGLGGVKAIVQQKEKLKLAEGAESTLEGALLPDHVQMLLKRAPPIPSTSASFPSANMTPSGTPMKERRRDSLSDLTSSHKRDHSRVTSEGNDSFTGSDHGQYRMYGGAKHHVKGVVQPDRPPRLNFLHLTTDTEFTHVLDLCNSSRCIQKLLTPTTSEILLPAPPATPPATAGSQDRCTTPTNQMAPSAPRSSLANKTTNDQAVNPLQGCNAPSGAAGPARLAMQCLSKALLFVSLAANVSYIFRMLDYRTREVLNALALLCGHTDACGLHPLIPHIATRECRNRCLLTLLTRVLVDIALGIALGFLVTSHKETFVVSTQRVAWYGVHDLHQGYLAWFEGWPGGLKLNDPLTHVFSSFHQSILDIWSDGITWLTPEGTDWIRLAFTSLQWLAPFGASFALAFVADCTNVVTQHLRMMFHIMSLVYRMFVSLLSCLLAQFRGTRVNFLKQRTDHYDFGMDQMILGTLLLTATLFLFPTVALYYFYLALVRTSVWIVQETLCAVAFLCSGIPLYPFLVWCVKRNAWPNGVELSHTTIEFPEVEPNPTPASPLKPQHDKQAPVVVHTYLSTRAMPLSSVLMDLKVTLWSLSQPFGIARLFRFVVFSGEKPCVHGPQILYPQLAVDPCNPKIPEYHIKA